MNSVELSKQGHYPSSHPSSLLLPGNPHSLQLSVSLVEVNNLNYNEMKVSLLAAAGFASVAYAGVAAQQSAAAIAAQQRTVTHTTTATTSQGCEARQTSVNFLKS